MSAPPQAIAPNPHTNLLNVYIQIVNKMGFQPTNQPTKKQNYSVLTGSVCCVHQHFTYFNQLLLNI
jgi:hypothetical protein